MAIQIISGNLNTYGNGGAFETDPSTWGFGSTNVTKYTIARSSLAAHEGLYSLRAVQLTDDNTIRTIAFGRIAGASTSKKYVAKAWVMTPTATPAATDATKISLQNIVPGVTTDHLVEDTTIAVCKDTWTEIEYHFSPLYSGDHTVYCTLLSSPTYSGDVIVGGVLYIDKFEIFEYLDEGEEEPGEDPPPPPEDFDKIFFHKNHITVGKAAVAGWDAINNYRLYADVRTEDESGSGVYESKLKVRLYPDSSGNVTFYIRQAFRELLDPVNIIPPDLQESNIVRLTDRIKAFKHFTGEIQDDEIEPAVLDESLPLLVMYGGINKYHFPNIDFFATYLPTNKKFLSWAPVEKEVDRLQEDYLTFLVYDATIAVLQLQAKIYYDDATNETVILKTKSGVTYGELYQFPAGPSNAGVLLQTPEKNVIKYELTLLNQDDVVISETRFYTVTSVRHPLTRFFMFLNSLGGYEVLRFTGQAKTETDFTREIVQRFLPHNYSEIDGELAINNVLMQDKTKFSSGHIKSKKAREWFEYMKDFMLSARIFDVTNGERRRVIITTNNLPGEEDQRYIRFMRFEAQSPFIDDSYTPSRI